LKNIKFIEGRLNLECYTEWYVTKWRYKVIANFWEQDKSLSPGLVGKSAVTP
jgi:hypothetical protein